MTSRRAFLAGLATLAAPLFARLALPAAPKRKLLGKRRDIPWKTGTKNEELRFAVKWPAAHLYVRVSGADGDERWHYLGEVEAVRFGAETSYQLKDAVFPISTVVHEPPFLSLE
jgi:hypothetical protein